MKLFLLLLTFFTFTLQAQGHRIYNESSIIWFSDQVKDKFKNPYIEFGKKFHKNFPSCQFFIIQPDKKYKLIGKQGTRLYIPANSFADRNNQPVQKEVRLCIKEIIYPLSFLFNGIGLYYQDKDKIQLLESAGMFFIDAHSQGKKVFLQRKKTVEIQFPNIQRGNFSLYRLDKQNQWQLTDKKIRQIDPQIENEWSEEGLVGVRIVAIGKTGWYNFDKPNPKFACLKGRLKTSGKDLNHKFIIMAIGMDHKFVNYTFTNPKSFYSIDVLKDKYYKIIAIDRNGNVGVSDTFRATSRDGFSANKESKTNYKQKVNDLEIKKIQEEILSSPNQFRRYLGIYRNYYQVSYPPDPR